MITRCRLLIIALIAALTRLSGVEAGQRISDIRISNRSAVSVVIGWTTGTATRGYVRYGIDKPADRAEDTRGNRIEDDIHYVRLLDLKPDTRYVFEVVSGDERVSDLTFKTTPLRSVAPPGLNVIGRLAASSPPEEQAEEYGIVYVSISRDGHTTPPLSVLARMDAKSYWTVNLGNMKSAKTGEPFLARAGDRIHIFASGGSHGAVTDVVHPLEDLNATAQDTGVLILKPQQ